MKFIDYNSLKEFYTITEVCELFEMAKSDLKEKCAQYSTKRAEQDRNEGKKLLSP